MQTNPLYPPNRETPTPADHVTHPRFPAMTLDFLVNPNLVVKPLRPVWYTIAQVSLPLGTRELDAVQLASALAIIFRVQIMLYDVFNRSPKRGRLVSFGDLFFFRFSSGF